MPGELGLAQVQFAPHHVQAIDAYLEVIGKPPKQRRNLAVLELVEGRELDLGRPYEEELLLAVAARLEESLGAWQAPPLRATAANLTDT